MSYYLFDNMQIAGMAAAVPCTEVKVESFAPTFGADVVHRFSEMTGVHSFRRTKPGQTASDLGFAAAEHLLQRIGLPREKIGILVFASLSPDYLRPATACVLHKRLGLSTNCTALDLGQGCSGFVYGLQTAAGLLNSSDEEYALLIAAETVSKLPYPKDKSSVMLLGDAGTATILKKSQGFPLQGLLGTNGNGYTSAYVPAGGFRNPNASRAPFLSADGIERTYYSYFMNGLDIFAFAVNEMPTMIKEFFHRSGSSPEDYDCFLPHQANGLIIKQLAKKLGFPASKVPISLDRYGNTSAAAIPLGLCSFCGNIESGRINTLMCGFGTGLSYGVAAASLDCSIIFPVIETDDFFAEAILEEQETPIHD